LSKKRLFIAVPFLLVFVVWAILSILKIDAFKVKERINSKNCEDEQFVKNKLISGKVIEKFADKRKINYFRYVQANDTLTSEWALLNDKTYNLLRVGDSIQKEKGSLEFKILKSEIDSTYIYFIDWDCDQ
jgi:hypothetical protein